MAYEQLAQLTSEPNLREYLREYYLKLGIADATTSCKLEPGLWKGYYLRARLYNGSIRKDATRLALADCDRAIRLAPTEDLPQALKQEIIMINRPDSQQSAKKTKAPPEGGAFK